MTTCQTQILKTEYNESYVYCSDYNMSCLRVENKLTMHYVLHI